MAIELYARPGCPFCAKVQRKLDELDLAYDIHHVPAARSQREEVRAISGQTGVPVLVDTDEGIAGMPESDDIVAYLDRTYGTDASNGSQGAGS